MRTHNIPSCYRKSKRSLLFLLTWRYNQPPLARTTPVCLELIFMVPMVFEPLKFDCTFMSKICICPAIHKISRALRLVVKYSKKSVTYTVLHNHNFIH